MEAESRRDLAQGGLFFVLASLCLFFVGLLAVGQTGTAILGGAVESTVTLDEGLDFSLQSLTLLTSLKTCGWTFSARAIASNNRFSVFDLTVDGGLGNLFLRSTTAFDIQTPSFKYLNATVQFSALDVTFRNTFFYTGLDSTSYDELVTRWSCNGIRFTARTRFGICLPEFRRVDLQASWAWLPCKATVGAKLSYDEEDGFDEFELKARGIVVPYLSGEGLTTYFDLKGEFTVDGKEIAPSLRVRSRTIGSCCLTPFAEVVWDDPPIVEGLSFYGLEFDVELENGIEAVFATSFDETKNRRITGEGDFFELWQFTGPAGSCCDRAGEWKAAVFFEEDHAAVTLFAWGKVSLFVEIPLAENSDASLKLELLPSSAPAPHRILTVGFSAHF